MLQGNITNSTNYRLNMSLIIYFLSLGAIQVGRFGRGVSFPSFIQIQHDILSSSFLM